MPAPRSPGRRVARGLAVRVGGSPVAWAATAVFLTLLVLWSVATPGFRSPDEAPHVNSVLRLADGGGWPEPGTAFLLPGVIRAKTLTGFSAVDGQYGTWSGGTLLPGVRRTIPESEQRYYASFAGQEVTPDGDRLPFGDLELTRPVESWRHGDQMTQHPPLYYGVSAVVVRALGALDWPFDRTLWLMRLVSVSMVMWVPLLAFATVRQLTGDRRLADVASLLPLAVPQLAALGASVQNDALVILLGGVATLLLSRLLRRDRSWRTLALLGVTLGLALLTKGSLLILVPVVGLAVVVALRRAAVPWPATLLRLAVVWGIAFVLGGWWWALNLLRYGAIQPEGIAIPVSDEQSAPRSSLLEFAGIFWERVTTSFWGHFGLLELPLPYPVVVGLTVVALALVVLAFRRRGRRLTLLVLLSISGLTAALVFWQTYQDHLATGLLGGMQGRYLYGGLVGLFAAMAIGLGTAVRGRDRVLDWLPAALFPVVLAIAAYGFWVGFSGFYLELDWSVAAAWRRMTDWSPWPDLGVRALVGLLVVLSLAACAVAVRSALRARPGGEGVRGTDLDGARTAAPAAVGS